jgi:hypothetical protein
MDNANNYTSKIPATQPKAPSQKTKDKRAQLQRQQHTRSLSLQNPPTKVSLKTPDKPVKTEPPAKTNQLEWTDKMRVRFNILLAKLNSGLLSVSDFIDSVRGMFGKRLYQHGDRQRIDHLVSEQPLNNRGNIARNMEALLPNIPHNSLAAMIGNDILAAAAPGKAEMSKLTDDLLKGLANESATAPDVIDMVHQLFGTTFHADDQEFIKSKVWNKAPNYEVIASEAARLAPRVDDFTAAVLGVIKEAAVHGLEAQTSIFMPQYPAKPSPAPATSVPPTVTKGNPIPPNPLTGNKLRYWDHRGTQAMKAFLDVLSGTDKQAKVDAYYYGTKSVKGLHGVIKEVTDKTGHADVTELDGWIDYTLKGRSRQEIASIVKSLTEGFGAQGDIYTNVRARLVRRAELLLKSMEDSEPDWNARGAAHTKRVIAALRNGSTAELKGAFFDPGFGKASYGKNPGLYEFIKQIVPNGNEARERACFDKWLGKALRGCTFSELADIWRTIEINRENPECPRTGVFTTFEQVLQQQIEERKGAVQFVRTVLTNGDVDAAAHTFEKRVKAIARGDSQLMHARMSALIAENLEKLSADERSRVKERCADLHPYPAATAMRAALGMSDPKAIDNLFVKLKAGDLSGSRAAFRLAQDQLRLGTRQEIKSQIETALKDLTVQQTIVIAKTYERIRIGQGLDELLMGPISSTVSAVVPAYFLDEYLIHGRAPFDALEVLEDVVVSNIQLNSNSPGRLNAALGDAIAPALGDLTDQELNELMGLDWSKASKDIEDAFSEQVRKLREEREKELANKYLLPQPVVIPKT